MTAADADGRVRTSRDGAVLTVTLDRPDQLNAQTPATWTALAAVGASLDDDVRVVVVRGAGRSFSAGLDRSLFSTDPATPGGLGELGSMPAELAQERIRSYQAAFRWLRSPGIVSVAGVQGHAIGAGAQLALAEAYRNVATSGAVPQAVTNCLNFGNPERPDVMWQFVLSIEGIADACTAFEIGRAHV